MRRFWVVVWVLLVISAVIGGGVFYTLHRASPTSIEDLISQRATIGTLYQMRLEQRLQTACEQILDKIVGAGRYQVSVIATLDLTTYKEEATAFRPNIVTLTEIEEFESQSTANEDAIEVVAQPGVELDLPGIPIPGTFKYQNEYSKDALPGFPPKEESQAPEQKPKTVQSSGGGTTARRSANAVKYSENKREVTSDVDLKKMMVTVVIDERLVKSGSLDRNWVTLFLTQSLPLDSRRGDTLTIRFVPFQPMWLESINVLSWLYWGVGGLATAGLCVVLFLFLRRLWRQIRDNRRRRQFDKARTALAVMEQQAALKHLMEEKKVALLRVLEDDPEHAASTILDWMENVDADRPSGPSH